MCNVAIKVTTALSVIQIWELKDWILSQVVLARTAIMMMGFKLIVRVILLKDIFRVSLTLFDMWN